MLNPSSPECFHSEAAAVHLLSRRDKVLSPAVCCGSPGPTQVKGIDYTLRHKCALSQTGFFPLGLKQDTQTSSESVHSYHVQQGLVVPEGSDHAHHRHREHHQAQQDEHHRRRQEEPLQGSILLPFHLSVHPHAQHTQAHQLGSTEGRPDKKLQELQRDDRKRA